MSFSIRDVHPLWVVLGWFLAAALTAAVLLALTAIGVVSPEGDRETLGVSLSLLLGFFWAGFIIATRAPYAPALHGAAIALFSLVVWVALNLLFADATGLTAWDRLSFRDSLVLLFLQVAGAVLGARAGARWIRSS